MKNRAKTALIKSYSTDQDLLGLTLVVFPLCIFYVGSSCKTAKTILTIINNFFDHRSDIRWVFNWLYNLFSTGRLLSNSIRLYDKLLSFTEYGFFIGKGLAYLRVSSSVFNTFWYLCVLQFLCKTVIFRQFCSSIRDRVPSIVKI